MNDTQVAAVARRCVTLFGDPRESRDQQTIANYAPPLGYPDSLALCVIDSIQSTGVRYPSVVAVVERYRGYRREQKSDANADGTAELLKTFSELHGPDGWAARIGNQHKTSTQRNAPLKAVAVHGATMALSQQAIRTSRDLREIAANPGRSGEVEAEWRGTVGQRSGITWHYVQMLAGVPGVKPDRMIVRFVSDSLGLTRGAVTTAFAGSVVTEAASQLDVSPTALDHAIWQWQRARPPGSATARRTTVLK